MQHTLDRVCLSVLVNLLQQLAFFTNVSFHFNKVPNKNDVYQTAVVLVNIYYVIFNQIEISNHDMTCLVSFNSVITFKENDKFVNNSGICGGGIALYESSQLLLNDQTYIICK